VKLAIATPDDVAAMAAVHGASFDEGWSADEIRAVLGGPGGFGLVARDSGLIAFVLARAIAGEAEVLTIAVEPGRRRQGAGRGLIEAVALHASALGATSLFLEVAAENASALALYQAAGFAQVGQRPAYYRRPGGAATALVLRRALNSPPA
jgi:ribosomal-protein-alanine N-acetyltransferase